MPNDVKQAGLGQGSSHRRIEGILVPDEGKTKHQITNTEDSYFVIDLPQFA